ncbi:hypothetical protein LCGC14_2887850, partial [marine sediment metagenome]
SIADSFSLYYSMMGAGAATTEIDLSGNGLGATVTNATENSDGPPVFLASPVVRLWMDFLDKLTNWFIPSVWASDVVICDPADPDIPNRVVSYRKSVNTQEAWLTDPTFLINPDLSGVAGIPRSYWKCNGSAVVEMSQAERDIVDAPATAEAARQQAAQDELDANEVSALNMTQVNARIDSISNLDQLKTFLKRLVRYLKAKEIQGGG